MKKFAFGILFLCCGLLSCTDNTPKADYRVVPLPQEITEKSGSDFVLNAETQIVYPKDNAVMERNANFLAEYIKEKTNLTLATTSDECSKAITLAIGDVCENKEGYQLTVTANGITITGASEAGVFYGIQTLRKSIPVAETAEVILPAVEINDYPRFSYRGTHLDVSRHFFNKEEIKSFIDMLAMHNINRFHWHLTDDQGWRIEIKKYPKLTSVGAYRNETVIGRNTGVYDGVEYGPYFYTQDDCREIIKYAAERHITIIPEIDLPGHMQAAIAAYPQFGCTGGPYEVWKMWGVSTHVLCAGNDATLSFIEDILSEVIDVFPSEYIHIGGDECPKDQWKICRKCQARIKKLGLKSDDKHSAEMYLQSFVISHAEKFLNSKGRQIIGWDEILDGGLAPNATVMSWRGTEGGLEAIAAGHKAIMSPGTYCYFDQYQDAPQTQPEAIGGYLPLEKVYSYNPVPEELEQDKAKLLYGVQANLWAEYIPTPEHMERMIYPRILAIAEIGWSAQETREYESFRNRALTAVEHLKSKGYNPFNLAEEVGNRPSAKQESQHLAKGKKATYAEGSPFYDGYAAGGDTALVDGKHGGWNNNDGVWQGFIKGGIDIVIDLEEKQQISFVGADFMQICNPWIFMPCEVTISASDDNSNFKELVKIEHKVVEDDSLSFKNFGWEGETEARYIRYEAKSDRKGGWLFTDEIVVK